MTLNGGQWFTAIMNESGALGARLTGAGFGGCAVALVSDDMIQKYMDNVRELYYNGYMKANRPECPECADIDCSLFAVKPSRGAQITAL